MHNIAGGQGADADGGLISGTRRQVGLAIAVITLATMLVGAGYGLNEFVADVRQDLPASDSVTRARLDGYIAVNRAEHTEMWMAINHGDTLLRHMDDKLDQVIQVLVESFCYQTEEPQEREDCIRRQTQRRMNELLSNGGAGGGSGNQ